MRETRRAGQVQIEQLGQAGNELEDWFLASLTDEERGGLHATLRKLFTAVTQAAR
jgi:hypothetical protein